VCACPATGFEREVKFAPGAKPELYHAVGQQDYTAIFARTPDGQIPIVRQYRPALERFTWELPLGTRKTRHAVGQRM
jgi:ADP-ribose pyrophosphatase